MSGVFVLYFGIAGTGSIIYCVIWQDITYTQRLSTPVFWHLSHHRGPGSWILWPPCWHWLRPSSCPPLHLSTLTVLWACPPSLGLSRCTPPRHLSWSDYSRQKLRRCCPNRWSSVCHPVWYLPPTPDLNLDPVLSGFVSPENVDKRVNFKAGTQIFPPPPPFSTLCYEEQKYLTWIWFL